jgi:hypothetical protein
MLIEWMLLQVMPSSAAMTFDLAAIAPIERRCGDRSGGEIVVCGIDRRKDRLPEGAARLSPAGTGRQNASPHPESPLKEPAG